MQYPVPELFLYRGRYQLATQDALYSDGRHYRPMLVAYKKLKPHLPDVKDVLVLGCGLGSAVDILHAQGYKPNYTLVDSDKEVLRWALELLPQQVAASVTPFCENAERFVAGHPTQYDLVILDIFLGREVPGFVTSVGFLQQCRKLLRKDGCFVLNYMVATDAAWAEARQKIQACFPNAEVSAIGINRVVTATV